MEGSIYSEDAPKPPQQGSTLNPESAEFRITPSQPLADPVDEFAHSRPPDDLFDDDFTPVEQTVDEVVPPSEPRQFDNKAGRGQSQRGIRGNRAPRGLRGRGQGGTLNIKDQPKETQDIAKVSDTADAEVENALPTSPRNTAVRGDRSATGGIRKAKFTEEELEAKFASMKIKNAAAEEAHRRQQADEDLFRQREQEEATKRLEERQNRREMDREREKNRARKLKAVGGREWDAEKKADDHADRGGRSSEFRRGAYGGIINDQAGNEQGENTGQFSAVRGARGGRGGRGRGRGRGRGQQDQAPSERTPYVNTGPPTAASDFPPLPATNAEKVADNAQPKISSPKASQGSGEKESWAEQVENTAT
ncbi:MAG: hypothetical protein M1814_004744 [Vezdaea aestivalis]|nr:MAG: hypothetical protein M1814_004744 [Vezdaea aestivalis]